MPDGAYHPEGRYAVLCVSGYDDRAAGYGAHDRGAARHGFDFYVVDTDWMNQVVRKFSGNGATLEAHLAASARRKAVRLCDKWNAEEAECLSPS